RRMGFKHHKTCRVSRNIGLFRAVDVWGGTWYAMGCCRNPNVGRMNVVKKMPLPEQEAKRLAALRRYGVLDTLPEIAFDELTRLAAQICGAPIALITLVDERRQWFKSRVGLEVTETAREISFCTYTILQDD